jgi:uncharacterized protein (TIGR03437 family)
MRRTGLAIAGALVLLAPSAWGYIRYSFNYSDNTSAMVKRNDATSGGVKFFLNSLIVPGLQSNASGSSVTVLTAGSNPVAAVRAALATWNAVPSSAARFQALQTTTATINPSDGQNTIAVGSTSSDISVLGGAFAFTVLIGAPITPGMPTGDVADSDIIVNPAYGFSTDGSTNLDFQAIITHELGHALGLNHTPLVGATMFQFAYAPARYLSADEISFASAVYPAKGATVPGTLAGKVVASDGSAVQSGLVIAMDTTAGTALGALTGQDGTWSLQVPAGSYVVYCDAMTSTSLVQPGNLYLTTATKVTSNFEATALGGFASPTALTVTSGNTTNAPNLTVTTGATALTPPLVGLGAAGGSSDIRSFSNTALAVPSGQSVDVGLAGGGIDGTVSVQALGAGVTVQPGSIRADKQMVNGVPVVRVTLVLAPRQTASLTSLIVTKGTNILAMSGALVIVPPAPKFTAAAVVSAASYKGPGGSGGVSPGGIYSIYDTTTNSLGPTAFAQPAGYDLYGNLGTSLGGVTVTFDGVAAPLFLSYSGQLNLQAPFEIAGKTSTQVVVNFNGSASAAVAVPVAATQPAFFTVTPLGADAIIQNFPDYSLNSASNPLARGGIGLLYGTGLGNLGYSLATGQPGTVPPSSYASKYSCSFGGVSASAYAYWNYGFVGEATWTVTVPSNAPTGAVSLMCTDSVSGNTTQQGAIYLK